MGGMYDEIPDYRYRLIDYVGDGFVIGSTYGSAFYFVRGFFSSPRGGRLAGGVHAVRTNLPRAAGVLAGRLAVFWALESGMALARRRREDHWNSIVAGTGTFCLVNMHRGGAAAARGALLGATFFVGLAGAYLNLEAWHSRVVRSGRETRRKYVVIPVLLPIRRVTPCPAALADAEDRYMEYRSENDARRTFLLWRKSPK